MSNFKDPNAETHATPIRAFITRFEVKPSGERALESLASIVEGVCSLNDLVVVRRYIDLYKRNSGYEDVSESLRKLAQGVKWAKPGDAA